MTQSVKKELNAMHEQGNVHKVKNNIGHMTYVVMVMGLFAVLSMFVA